MSQILKYDFDRMSDAYRVLFDANTDIASALNALESEALILSTSWTGQAASAYQTAQKEWLASGEELNETLSTFAGLLSTITEAHRATEKEVLELWSS